MLRLKINSEVSQRELTDGVGVREAGVTHKHTPGGSRLDHVQARRQQSAFPCQRVERGRKPHLPPCLRDAATAPINSSGRALLATTSSTWAYLLDLLTSNMVVALVQSTASTREVLHATLNVARHIEIE